MFKACPFLSTYGSLAFSVDLGVTAFRFTGPKSIHASEFFPGFDLPLGRGFFYFKIEVVMSKKLERDENGRVWAEGAGHEDCEHCNALRDKDGKLYFSETTIAALESDDYTTSASIIEMFKKIGVNNVS